MMAYKIKLIFYSLVLGTFLLSGVAFSANSADETKDLIDQPVKNITIQPTAKTKGHLIKKGGGSVNKDATKMPDDPFGKTKNEMTKRPPDPLERNNGKSLMMPEDPLEKNNIEAPMLQDDPLN